MDRAIAIFIFFVIIVVGTILVAPSYIDWNRYRGAIEAYAEDITGRDVSIEGDIGFALLPVPELTLSKFSIANDESEDARKMISLDRLELRAALKPLLSLRVELTDVRLIRPLIAVEVLAGNQTNWKFAEREGAAPRKKMQAPWWLSYLLSAIRLDNMTVEDGTLTYSDAELQVSDVVRDLNGIFSATTLDGPFTAKGRANFRGVDIRFDSTIGDMSRVRAVPAKLTITFAPSKAELAFRGFLEEASLFGPAVGRLSFTSTDGGAGWTDLMSLMRGEDVPKPKGRLAKIFGQDLEIETDVRIADRVLTAEELILGLGGVRAKGEVTARLGRASSFTAKLSARSVNLDSLFEEAAATQKSVNMAKAAPTIEKELSGFILPDSLSGTIDIQVDGVIYRAGVIQNLVVEAVAENGHIKVKRATGRLPGKTAFIGEGNWLPVTGGTRFDGQVTLNSENPRAFLAWAGLPVDEVAVDLLNQMSVAGQLVLTPSRMELNSAEVTLDGRAHQASFSLEEGGQGPRYGVAITSDELNLDSYAVLLPAGVRDFSWFAASGDDGRAPRETLERIALNVQAFTWQGTRMRGVDVDVRAHDGALEITRFRIADYDGAQINVRGRVGKTLRRPDFALAGSLRADSPAPLFKLFGFPVREFKGAGTTFFVFGGALGRESDSVTLEAVIQQKTGGAVKMKGKVTRTDGAYVLDVKSTGPDGSLVTLNGTSNDDLTRYDAALSAHAPDLTALAAAYGVDYRTAGELGALDLTAELSAEGEELTLTSLTAQVGKAELNLNGTLNLNDEGPVFDVEARLKDVRLDDFKPVEAPVILSSGLQTVADIEALQNQILGTGENAADQDGWFPGARGRLRLMANSISSGAYAFKNLKGALTLNEGIWVLSDLNADLFGGELSGSVSYSAGDLLPELSGALSLKSAGLKPALAAFLKIDKDAAPLSGQADFDFTFSALGRTKTALTSSLNGAVTLAASDGAFEGFDVLALIAGIDRATSLATYRAMAQDSMSAGRSHYQTLYGVVPIEDGKILLKKNGGKTEEESLLGILAANAITDTDGAATIDFDGVIDLNTRLIAGQGRVRLVGEEGAPALNIRLTGPLSAPRRQIESASLGAFYIDDFAARADNTPGTETDRQIEVFRSAIDTLDAQN